MKLDSAREAKATVLRNVLGLEELANVLGESAGMGDIALARREGAMLGYGGDVLSDRFNERRAMQLRDFHSRALISVGIELTPGRKRDASLVILCQSRRAYDSDRADLAIRAAKGEARKVLVGPVRRLGPSRMDPDPGRGSSSPLRIGSSLGHRRVTAGTLGCFVRGSESGICALSNNHILANTNAADLHDPIISPARADGGRDPGDRCGALYRFVPINLDGVSPNLLDCAVATVSSVRPLEPNDLADPTSGRRIGQLKAVPAANEDCLGLPVAKIGRTTGLTIGEVVAMEVDGIRVMMDANGYGRTALFNGQIVVAGRGGRFSKGGDSGSVVFSHPGEQPVGLLFAGSDRPYGDGFGPPTFANPMELVLAELRCEIYVG